MSITTTRAQDRIKKTKAKIEQVEDRLAKATDLLTQATDRIATAEKIRSELPALKQMRDERVNVLATYLGEQSCLPPDQIDEAGLVKAKAELGPLQDCPLDEEDQLAALNAKGYDTATPEAERCRCEEELVQLNTVLRDQEAALSRKDRAYPWLLAAHLRHCQNSGYKDAQGRTKAQAKLLKEAILQADRDRVAALAKAEQDRIDAEVKKLADLAKAEADLEAQHAAEVQKFIETPHTKAEIQAIVQETVQALADTPPTEPVTEQTTAGLGDQP